MKFCRKIFVFSLILLIVLNTSCSEENQITNNRNNEPELRDKKIEFSGKIIDLVAYPVIGIENALVKMKSQNINVSVFTDKRGYFYFGNLPNENYELQIVKSAYDTLREDIKFSADSLFKDFRVFEINTIYDYSEGIIALGFNDTSTVEHIYTIINSLNLKIQRLNGFIYTSLLPIDSLDYVRSFLSTKSYLWITNENTIYVSQNSIKVYCTFIEFDEAAISDWFITKEKLQLNSINTKYRDGIIEVPINEEIKWARAFREYMELRWITLDYFFIKPL